LRTPKDIYFKSNCDKPLEHFKKLSLLGGTVVPEKGDFDPKKKLTGRRKRLIPNNGVWDILDFLLNRFRD
jgi:hypothetical protein